MVTPSFFRSTARCSVWSLRMFEPPSVRMISLLATPLRSPLRLLNMSSRAIRKASCVLVRPRVMRKASAFRTSYLLLYVLRWNLTSVLSENVAKATWVLSNENSSPCTTCLMKFRTRLYVSSTLPEKSNKKTTSSKREQPEM